MGKPVLSDKQLTAFKHVMECGSVSGAAKRMFIAQPGVTRLLKQLEHDIGFTLFERIKGRLVQTPEARLFYREQCRVWEGLDHLRDTARRIRSRDMGHLRIGAMPLLGLQFMPDVITAFLTQHPGTKIDLFTERSEQVVEDVVTQRVDVGLSLVGEADQRVDSHAFELSTVCLMPATHPLAKHKVVSLEDLQDQPLIDYELNDSSRRQLDELLDEKNISPNRIMQVSFALQASRLVQNGLGITLIDNITALSLRDNSLTTRPLEMNVTTTVYLLTANDQPISAVTQDFLPFLIQHLPRQAN